MFRINRLRHKLTVLIIGLVIGAAALGLALGWGITELMSRTETISDAQVVACERNNELRESLREEKDTEIEFLENLPRVFPKVNPSFFELYTAAQIENIEHNKKTVFKEVKC